MAGSVLYGHAARGWHPMAWRRPTVADILVDGIDVMFPAPGGPDLAAVADALNTVLRTGRVAAVGVGCTWHPGYGAAQRVAAVVRTVLDAWR